MKLIIFGPPGSGKGTQSAKLSNSLHIKHISTGDILRNMKQDNTVINTGNFVSDEYIYDLIKDELQHSYILDGFPRNVKQCEMLGEITAAIFIDVDLQICTERILNRNENRKDDNHEVIEKRLRIYKNEINAILDFYEEKKKLYKVCGVGDVDVICENILDILKNIS